MNVPRCKEVVIKEECMVKQEDICHDYKELKCEKIPKRQCRPSFVENCKTENKCETIQEEKCRSVPKKECQDVQNCRNTIKTKCVPDSYHGEICDEIPSKECKTRRKCRITYEKKCESVPKQNCRDVQQCVKKPSERCKRTYINKCSEVPKRICTPVAKKLCRPVKKSVVTPFRQRICPTCKLRPPTEIVKIEPKRKCFNERQEPRCLPRYERECKKVPDEKCQTNNETKCLDIPEEICEPVLTKECRKERVQECQMMGKNCKPHKECTTKYEMKCEATPGYDAPSYGYVQEHCDYKPVEECKNGTKCEGESKEVCKPILKENCSEVKMQKCQTHFRRECTPQPKQTCQASFKTECKDVYKGETCEKTRPTRRCHTVEEERRIFQPNRPLCVWPVIPQNITCGGD